jgi:hypothetical protein
MDPVFERSSQRPTVAVEPSRKREGGNQRGQSGGWKMIYVLLGSHVGAFKREEEGRHSLVENGSRGSFR